MKKILILLFIVTLVGCQKDQTKEISFELDETTEYVLIDNKNEINYNIEGANFSDLEITHHEYIKISEEKYIQFSHPGIYEVSFSINQITKVKTYYVYDSIWKKKIKDKFNIEQFDTFNLKEENDDFIIVTLNLTNFDIYQNYYQLEAYKIDNIEFYISKTLEGVYFNKNNNLLTIYIIKNKTLVSPNSQELSNELNDRFNLELNYTQIFYVEIENNNNEFSFRVSNFLDYNFDLEIILFDNDFEKVDDFSYINLDKKIKIEKIDNKYYVEDISMILEWDKVQQYLFENYEISLADFNGFNKIIIEVNPESNSKYTYKLYGISNVQNALNDFLTIMYTYGYELTEASDSHLGSLINYEYEHIIIGYHESHGDETAIDIVITILPIEN